MTPAWLQGVIDNSQKIQTAKDEDNFRLYLAACLSWIDNNMRNRDAGNPLTAPPALPTVTTFFDAGGYMDSHTVPNPAALPPVLPPPGKTQPPTPFTTGAAARDQMMFDLLTAIQRDVAQIKAVVAPGK
jgi:hypothetical protein